MDSVLDIEGLIRRLEALERGETLPPSTPAVPPARKISSKAKVLTSPSIKKAVAVEPASVKSALKATKESAPVLEEPMPALDKKISNRQVWDKMLVQFEKSPFVYDVLINSSVEFTTENEWTLTFAPGKEFYQIPAQNKLPELAAAATQLSGRKITIVLASDRATASGTQVTKANQSSLKVSDDPILDEEPFAQGPEVMAAASSLEEAPEEVKDVLEIFPGELIA